MARPGNTKANEQPVNWTYVGMVSFIAAIGGLLFGFDTGVIAGTIGGIVKDFDLNAWQEGFAVSNLIIACIFGSVLTGPLTDRFGRKRMLLLAGILFTFSAVLSGLPRHYWQLIVARFIGGLGVGIASVLSPIYIAELAPARVRGILVSINQLAIVVGILLTYISNWLLVGMSENDWRWMFEVEAVPALLFTLAIFFIPESPRWLAKNSQDNKAMDIFRRIGGDDYARGEMERVRKSLEKEEGGLIELLNPRLRVLLFVGFSLAIFANATGINVIIYYGAEIFKMAGFIEKASSFKAQMIIGLTNLLFTFAGMALIDRVGRRVLHVFAYGLMTLSMLFLGLMFNTKDIAPIWMVIPVMTYVASFACGVGVVIWVYLSEMFPNKIRGAAMGIATMLIWGANFVVTQFFPILRDKMGGNVFFLFTGASLIAFLFALIMMRETKGLHLEEIDTAFDFPDLDIVLGEGFSQEKEVRKILVLREGVSKRVPYPQGDILALVSDFKIKADKPVFKPDDVSGIANFVEQLLIQEDRMETSVTLIINKKPVPLNPFVQSVFKNVIVGIIGALKREDEKLKQIEVIIKSEDDDG